MQEDPKLAPCPIAECGGRAYEFTHHDASGGIKAYGLKCDRCGLEVLSKVPSNAMAVWGRARPVEGPADLREALEKIESQAVCGPIAVDMDEAVEMLLRIANIARKALVGAGSGASPEARPMRLRARAIGDSFNLRWVSLEGREVVANYGIPSRVTQEIAFRINAFEPTPGEASERVSPAGTNAPNRSICSIHHKPYDSTDARGCWLCPDCEPSPRGGEAGAP